MKILVLSDNHYKSLDEFDFSKYSYVIHCGDCGLEYSRLMDRRNIISVRGNCDFRGNKNFYGIINGKRIYVTHGDLEHVKIGLNTLVYKALELGAQVVFFGHTHQLTCFVEEGILFINPGSYPNSYVVINDEDVDLIVGNKVTKFKYKW